MNAYEPLLDNIAYIYSYKMDIATPLPILASSNSKEIHFSDKSVTKTDYDIYSETGRGIPGNNFKLLSAWVKHCEHSNKKHNVRGQTLRLAHFTLAILSMGTVMSMTIISAILPNTNVATVIQSAVAAFLMALQNVLDLQGRSKNHLVAGGEYSILGREIATTLGTADEERNWGEMCRLYQRQLDITESNAPPL